MGAIFGPIVLFVIVAVVVVVMVKRSVSQQTEVREALAHPDVPALRYRVPEGQDPAAVLAALHGAGYTATADDHGGGDQGVLIGGIGDEAPDREEVRRVLAGEGKLNFEGDTTYVATPHFDDE